MESLIARWPSVMAYDYDSAAVARGGIRPGEVRANIFDFIGGLRIIASVEKKSDGRRILHVSASFAVNSTEYKNVERLLVMCRGNKHRALDLWVKTAEERFKQLAGSDADGIQFQGMAHGYIPHWWKEIKEDVGSNIATEGGD